MDTPGYINTLRYQSMWCTWLYCHAMAEILLTRRWISGQWLNHFAWRKRLLGTIFAKVFYSILYVFIQKKVGKKVFVKSMGLWTFVNAWCLRLRTYLFLILSKEHSDHRSRVCRLWNWYRKTFLNRTVFTLYSKVFHFFDVGQHYCGNKSTSIRRNPRPSAGSYRPSHFFPQTWWIH